MAKWLVAGAVYFLVVFAAAFALGIMRVLLVVPEMGILWATVLELPFTLAISWVACTWIIHFTGPPSLRQAITMGAGAFVLLMTAEAIGSFLIFRRSPGDLIATFGTMAGALGLIGQIAFALFPPLQSIRDNPTGAHRTPPRQ